MANHKSAIKRIRSTETRRVHNRYFARTMRNAIKDFRGITEKKEAEEKFNNLISFIDKNSKRNIIHKNKAANIKAKLAKQLNSL